LKGKVYSHKQLIGNVDLDIGDEAMGGLFGEFIPNKFYFEKIQKDVWDFWKTSKPNYKKWYALRLNVQLENGIFLFPQGGYTIDDIEELPNLPKRIDIIGIDNEILHSLSLKNTNLIEEPWNFLTIEQKTTFEDELKKEIGIEIKSFFNFTNKSKKQLLYDTEFSALFHDIRNDNVLFEIRKPNSDNKFALVHLTWIGKEEKHGYPKTTLYSNFNDFKISQMYNDKNEWQENENIT